MEGGDNNEELVTFITQDGQSFTMTLPQSNMSETIRNLIEDSGTENPIPLPNVNAKIFAKVKQYCEYHIANPSAVVADADAGSKRTDDIIGWDLDFCKVDQPTLFELILAANYLDIKELLDVCCKTVANMIKGKTPAEIRATFNIANDFTKDEEDAVRKENE